MDLLTIRPERTEPSDVIFTKLLPLSHVLHILKSMEVELLAFLTSIAEPALIVRTLFYIVVWKS